MIIKIGSPNVGKSVLLNNLILSKLAATCRKRHTTRSEILGVFNYRNIQLAFYDTPGYVSKDEALKNDAKTLRKLATTSVEKADVVLLVVDALRCSKIKYHDTFAEMVQISLNHCTKELILVLNKVDLVEPKTQLLETTRILVSLINGVKLDPSMKHLAKLDTTTFMVSALNNDGLIDIKNYLLALADRKPWILSAKQGISDIPIEGRVEQMVLEKLLDHTHEEIPYIADIECTSITNANPTNTRSKIDVNIWVDTSSQVRIIIGQQGRTLVKIRQAAVVDLEKIIGKQIILMLWVKIRNKNKRNIDQNDI